mgnify:CR=1 FL=1
MRGPWSPDSSASVVARPGAAVLAVLLLAFTVPDSATAQQTGAVSGQVTAAGTGEPLSGAQVVVVGTQVGGLTDADGQYRLEQVPTGQQSVRVQLIGYSRSTKAVDVAAGQAATVNFRLHEEALQMDQIVVTGTPGEEQMRSLGNTIGTIDAEQLNEVSAEPSAQNLLSGSSPGVNVDLSSGKIGSSANIRIRGAGSIALNSSPVIYIDGVRVTGAGPAEGGGGGVGVSDVNPPTRLNDLNPQNIERIEVIKGPSAATLYGSEASNGVINIITKEGQTGDATLRVQVSGGFNKLPSAAADFFPNSYFRCQGVGDCQAGEVVEFNVLRHDQQVYGNDWFQWGPSQSYDASLSGGSEEIRYFFSGGFTRDEGVLPTNWKRKLNARANLNWAPTGDLGVQFRMGAVDSRMRSPGANQSWMVAINWACPAPGCEANSGSPWAMDGPFRGYLAYLPETLQNNVFGYQDVLRTTGSVQLTYNPTEWMDHRLTVGGDLVDTKGESLFLLHEIGSQAPGGFKGVQNQSEQHVTVDYSATARASVTEDLSLATSAGLQYISDQRDWAYAEGDQFSVRGLSTVSAGAQKDAAEGYVANKSLGVYVQEKISWQNRFFLTGAVRGDDNSAFGEQFDFVVFPKLSASWVVSEEPFMEGQEWLNNLKLRAAWGESGQQPDAFAAVRRWIPVAGPGGSGALAPENVGNPELKPEVGREWETGFDASFMNQRLAVQFTYYSQDRRDAILQVPVRPSSGFPGTQLQNIGSVHNEGIELSLNGRPIQGDEVSLDMGVNLNTMNNTIESMGGLPPQTLENYNPTTGFAHQYYVEGQPLGAIFLKKVVSADIQGSGASAQAVNAMCESGPIIPGTSNFSRGGGSPVPCDEAPAIYRGTPVPSLNASGTATLRLFDRLRVFGQLDYRGGATMINGDIAGSHLFFRNSRAINERTNAKLLALEAMGQDGINQSGLMDADYLRLRTLSASYNFPADMSQLIGADQVRLTLAGQNLWTPWQATEEIFGRPMRKPGVRTTAASASDPGGLTAYTQGRWPALHRFTARIDLSF